jgi:hypothetical protein
MKPRAMIPCPIRTPVACQGPKYGVCGKDCEPIPKMSAMPAKTATTKPVAVRRVPISEMIVR